jgi:hypothetical protein
MAENIRVRLESDIADYLKAQSERVLGKDHSLVTATDLTTLTNRLLYEHKMAQLMARQIPFARLFNWLTGLAPGNKVVALQPQVEQQALAPKDDFSIDADLGDLYDEAA